MSATMRYAPQRAFPAYAFLPGQDPHPTSDPLGHSYAQLAETPAAYFEAARWRDNSDYLYGVDLYNHGFLWEAHEAWEGLWHKAKHDAPQAEFLQGLIQCAAAALKVRMQQPRGVEKLSTFGLARLERAARAAGPEFMGLDVFEFVRAFRTFAESAPSSAEARPRMHLQS